MAFMTSEQGPEEREERREREREEGKKRGNEGPFGSLIKGVWSCCLCKGPGVSMYLVGLEQQDCPAGEGAETGTWDWK